MTTQLNLLDRDWIADKMPAFVSFLNQWDGTFTSDELHRILGEPPHPNWFGVFLANAKRMGLIEKIGWKESERKSANGRVVRLWQRKT